MSTGIYPCACILITIVKNNNNNITKPRNMRKRIFFKVQYKVSQACEIHINYKVYSGVQRIGKNKISIQMMNLILI